MTRLITRSKIGQETVRIESGAVQQRSFKPTVLVSCRSTTAGFVLCDILFGLAKLTFSDGWIAEYEFSTAS